VEYEIEALGKGAFEVIPQGNEIEFIAELGLGSDLPILGTLIDVVFRVMFSRRLKAMRQHMREEGQNLKKIIESGWKLKSSVEATI
jgi:hypothetical protein